MSAILKPFPFERSVECVWKLSHGGCNLWVGQSSFDAGAWVSSSKMTEMGFDGKACFRNSITQPLFIVL